MLVVLVWGFASAFAATAQAQAQIQSQQTTDEATKALFLAIDRNDLEAVRKALNEGADIEARDYSGTQPVDLAIDRGYYDIARFLISVRNTQHIQTPATQPGGVFKGASDAPLQSQPPGTAPATDTDTAPNTDTATTVAPAPTPPPLTPSANNPFAVTRSTPPPAPASLDGDPASVVAITAPTTPEESTPEKPAKVEKKPSAAKTFITTFFNFFAPPNTTGVTRREAPAPAPSDALSDAEVARQLKEIEAEQGDAVIRGPEVPISPEELAQELPPPPEIDPQTLKDIGALPSDTSTISDLPAYPVQKDPAAGPAPSSADAFGDFAVSKADEAATPAPPSPDTADSNPFAVDDNPFASPSAPSSEDNPFAASEQTSSPDKQAPGVPGKPYDPRRPFGGGVDPDVLAFLGLDERTGKPLDVADNAPQQDAPPEQQASIDAQDNPFEDLSGEKTPAVSDLLQGLNEPQTPADAPSQPSGESDNPFADPAPDTGGDDLAGLLESTDQPSGWEVKKVDEAAIPDQVAVLSTLEPTGKVLDGVEFTIGSDVKLGQEIDPQRLKLATKETTEKSCVPSAGTNTIFCIDTVNWPFELEEAFLVDTIMYQGTRAIARYDAGRATNFQTLFRSSAFANVIAYYTNLYGQPSRIVERSIAPLAAPRQANPTYLWQSREPGTDSTITLEIRKFDDTQGGGFPDTNRGVVMLYGDFSKPIFPQLSQLELMVLKANDTRTANSDPFAQQNTGQPASPDDIWN